MENNLPELRSRIIRYFASCGLTQPEQYRIQVVCNYVEVTQSDRAVKIQTLVDLLHDIDGIAVRTDRMIIFVVPHIAHVNNRFDVIALGTKHVEIEVEVEEKEIVVDVPPSNPQTLSDEDEKIRIRDLIKEATKKYMKEPVPKSAPEPVVAAKKAMVELAPVDFSAEPIVIASPKALGKLFCEYLIVFMQEKNNLTLTYLSQYYAQGQALYTFSFVALDEQVAIVIVSHLKELWPSRVQKDVIMVTVSMGGVRKYLKSQDVIF